jgi:hypothetical protein
VGFDASATNARYRRSIRHAFGEFGAPHPPGAPRFVVFHTLLPHDPYVYSAAGRPLTFKGRTDASLSAGAGRAAYLQQLDYLDGQLLRAIDRIDANAAIRPIIVIQSDEGFQAAPEDFGDAAMRDVRVKGLLALRLPGLRTEALPAAPNTVNTLRVVLNQALGNIG